MIDYQILNKIMKIFSIKETNPKIQRYRITF
jgi:hypothetical protein